MFEFFLGIVFGAAGAGFFAYMYPDIFKSTTNNINSKFDRK